MGKNFLKLYVKKTMQTSLFVFSAKLSILNLFYARFTNGYQMFYTTTATSERINYLYLGLLIRGRVFIDYPCFPIFIEFIY